MFLVSPIYRCSLPSKAFHRFKYLTPIGVGFNFVIQESTYQYLIILYVRYYLCSWHIELIYIECVGDITRPLPSKAVLLELAPLCVSVWCANV